MVRKSYLTGFMLAAFYVAGCPVAVAADSGAAVDTASFGAFVADTSGSRPAHSLAFERLPAAQTITTGLKSYLAPSGERIDDVAFRDGLGREAYFRGWNVSGTSKLVESGFKPFTSNSDAQTGIGRMADMTAPNLIRLLVGWEGINPAPDTIDYAYLDQVAEQMHAAISRRIYILVDFHQDLFSRYLFNQGSWYTGEGAPAWVLPKGDYPQEYCGIICTGWSQLNLTDEAIRRPARNFWNNQQFTAPNGKTYQLQDVFLWQLQKSLAYLKSKFSPQEFAYVLGVDPWNEPIDGGMEGLTPRQWENQKLWPFYAKARIAADQAGWNQKWVYSEPLVFWNTNVGIVAPATGGRLLDTKPGPGFVFNTHFYDAGRQALDFSPVDNATYFQNFDDIRKESRYRGNAVLLSEFGASVGGTGRQDTVRTIQAMYQGAEASDAIGGKTRYLDFYSAPISGTEWQWDHYYDHHHEYMNFNPSKLITSDDGWNGENYSVAKDFSMDYTLDFRVIERAYPRRTQGDLMNFYYNDMAQDASALPLNWAAIRPRQGGPEWFGNAQFVLVTWRGRRSDAPTEIVLPRYWKPENLAVLTDKTLHSGDLVKNAPLTQLPDEVALVSDSISTTASRLLVWDDPDTGEDASSIHFALVVNQDNSTSASVSPSELEALRHDLITALCRNKRGVVYLTGTMNGSGYPTGRL
ncbi:MULTISPECIES: cellulase family glycosylhydrolase [Paraburkholderia]|uniref:cellulase family glycosylhydrolase n=1 Tax=Paraburkholderia TaxID=1822464 RepID=UPI0022570CD5|nr:MULTISPECIES: cellulase family glycosylhydrolase [Paraburkholderia]MCX4160915.1 cellulase family glycosylhydrolase [Paraburkholderia megapolitana]MDN7156411.1 glycoside hydrolase family 5 protein [Paraburkholderia sp. CHISQ3]MDQ6493456.1 glycoside hydrolase family 5 protein [Paraburkholderia megapolitana]